MESPQKHACRTPEQAEPCGRHGPAVDDCREDEEGYFVVGNDEYSSYANFCPFCGAKAPSPIPTKP